MVLLAASTWLGTLIVGIVFFWNWDVSIWIYFLFNIAWYWGGFFLSNLLLGLSESLNQSDISLQQMAVNKSRKGFFGTIKQRFDPVNQLTPAQVVKSVPSIWSRVPLAIYNGYHSHPEHMYSVINQEALMGAMIGADVVVYNRNENSCTIEEPLIFAMDLLKRMKSGSKSEKLSDATFALLLGEMLKGGTNISSALGTQAVELGFSHISQNIIKQLCASPFPPSPELIGRLTKEGLDKALNMA